VKPPRIVYVDHVARLSGGEIALVRLLRALGDNVDAHVVLGEDGPLVQQLEEAGATVHVLALPRHVKDTRKDAVRPAQLSPRALAQTAAHVWRLRRLLRELSPDLVHTNSLKAAFYGGLAGRLAAVPVVWHVRDRIAVDYLPWFAVWLVRFNSRVLPSWIVANSHSTLETLPRLGHMSVVNSGVVHDSLPRSPDEVPSLHGVSDSDEFVVGIVGRLARWKGQHVFLEAFSAAFPGGAERAVLVGSAMFGEDDYEAALRVQASSLGLDDRVEFRGFREDVSAELARFDVLVHCSITPEPFGQVVVEGMAAGLAVIASAAGGPAEIISHEHDGLLVAPGDVEELAAAMLRLAKDPRLRTSLGDAARTSSERFDPAVVAEQMLSVYRRLLPELAPVPKSEDLR
jgi:glycosyltransferase involved in cell wall biosynthesis